MYLKKLVDRTLYQALWEGLSSWKVLYKNPMNWLIFECLKNWFKRLHLNGYNHKFFNLLKKPQNQSRKL